MPIRGIIWAISISRNNRPERWNVGKKRLQSNPILPWLCAISVGVVDSSGEDYPAAIDWYRKAIDADKDGNAIFLAECDEIMENHQRSP